MTIDELIERSHRMAIEKGWWPDGGRSVVEQVNNFHAEISEAWEEYQHGRMETWLSKPGEASDGWNRDTQERSTEEAIRALVGRGFKPEGFWVEIADLCIRIADTMGAYGWRFSPLRASDVAKIAVVKWHPGILVSTLHICVGCLGIADNGDIGTAWERGCERSASGTIDVCFGAAAFHRVDLFALCELKMQYNATRPTRHGGLKA